MKGITFYLQDGKMVICMVDMIVWYRTLPKEPLPILKAVPVLIKIP